MKEVNEAYDRIVQERKQAKNGGSTGSSYGGYTGYSAGGSSTNSNYIDVRNLINSGRLADAEQILNGVPQEQRNAEWFFLKGTILYRRGWVDEAFRHVKTAIEMDPNNLEYRTAYNQMNSFRSGAYGGYNPNMQRNNSGCTGCDVCSSLLCADCCCECMGGDLIRCC
jgi:hypothetical protein